MYWWFIVSSHIKRSSYQLDYERPHKMRKTWLYERSKATLILAVNDGIWNYIACTRLDIANTSQLALSLFFLCWLSWSAAAGAFHLRFSNQLIDTLVWIDIAWSWIRWHECYCSVFRQHWRLECGNFPLSKYTTISFVVSYPTSRNVNLH